MSAVPTIGTIVQIAACRVRRREPQVGYVTRSWTGSLYGGTLGDHLVGSIEVQVHGASERLRMVCWRPDHGQSVARVGNGWSYV